MPLFAVERDLSHVPPERFRTELKGLVSACARLKGVGKRVRYISSAVFPSEARGLCLFGAEQPQWIREVNEAAGLPYSRIFAVLDLTPAGVRRDLSCGRRPAETTSDAGRARRDETVVGPSHVGDDIVRWSDEGRQLLQTLGGWLEEAGAIHDEAETLERERAAMAQELRRLEQDNNALRAQRDELHEALQTIVSQTTRTADEILYRLEARRGAPGDLASR